eukprot:Rhum_TRINITY_DN14262_c9_g2::Rhum_TRINITY_DN14262_c9_g2_i1::g.73787::m.73787
MAFDSMAGAMGDAVAVIRQHDKEFECVVGNYGFAEKRRYGDEKPVASGHCCVYRRLKSPHVYLALVSGPSPHIVQITAGDECQIESRRLVIMQRQDKELSLISFDFAAADNAVKCREVIEGKAPPAAAKIPLPAAGEHPRVGGAAPASAAPAAAAAAAAASTSSGVPPLVVTGRSRARASQPNASAIDPPPPVTVSGMKNSRLALGAAPAVGVPSSRSAAARTAAPVPPPTVPVPLTGAPPTVAPPAPVVAPPLGLPTVPVPVSVPPPAVPRSVALGGDGAAPGPPPPVPLTRSTAAAPRDLAPPPPVPLPKQASLPLAKPSPPPVPVPTPSQATSFAADRPASRPNGSVFAGSNDSSAGLPPPPSVPRPGRAPEQSAAASTAAPPSPLPPAPLPCPDSVYRQPSREMSSLPISLPTYGPHGWKAGPDLNELRLAVVKVAMADTTSVSTLETMLEVYKRTIVS